MTPENRDELRDQLKELSVKLGVADDAANDETLSGPMRAKAERNAAKYERVIALIESALEEDEVE